MVNRIKNAGISSWGKKILVLCLLLFLAAAGCLFSLLQGSVQVMPGEILQILLGNSSGTNQQIIMNIRLPRTIVAALVGMNLSLSGAVLQAIMKNPLADPHIIGISSGAGLAGIIIMILFPSLEQLITPAAFCGAMAAAVCIYILAWKGGIRPVRMILAGVAVSAFLGAGISALLIFYSDRVHGALMWMVGGLAARSWPHAAIIFPYACLGSVLAYFAASRLNVLQLGDEMARSLGLRVEFTRIWLTAVAALLAASAVSVVGLLGFVGLIVPHAARLLIGSDHHYLLPASAFLGMAVVTICDTISRTLFAPVELPVGILMAVLGAPFFLFLLRREL